MRPLRKLPKNTEALADLDAVEKGIADIIKGMAGSFLQSGTAQVLRTLPLARKEMLYAHRQKVLSVLSGTQATRYAPASGQIVDILKQITDELQADYPGQKLQRRK